jgi:glycosyltransferase involved in cell wall biosynthesis
MSQVTIGVPVYNGADYLEKCLSCLRDQTYRDFEVLIFDNCSEDATGEIAQRFCAEDARFRYHRQPENKGALRNFLEVLEAAQSPYFMWRAADDVSDLNYVDVLLNLLLANPDRDFAVPRILSVLPDGSVAREYAISPHIEWKGAAGRLAQLFLSNNGWVYGLARREALTRIWKRVVSEFPYVKSADTAMLFPFAFDRKFIGTHDTTQYAYLRFPGARPDYAKRLAGDGQKLERGRALLALARQHVDRVIPDPAERRFYHLVLAYWTHKRGGYSITKRLRFALSQPFLTARS